MRKPHLEDRVSDYLKSERQWPRYCRVRKARMALRNENNEQERQFWDQVLSALGATNRMIPSTAALLERSLLNDESRRESPKVPVAEIQ